MRKSLAALMLVMGLLIPGVGFAAPASASSTMDCSGLGTISLQRQMSFGPAGWVAQMGTRSDGYVGFKVFHPSGRWDQFRVRMIMDDGREHLAQDYYTSLCSSRWTVNGIRKVNFEARNGGDWHVSSWWWV